LREIKNRESYGEWKYVADFHSEPHGQVDSIVFTKNDAVHIYYQISGGASSDGPKVTDAWTNEIFQKLHELGHRTDRSFLHEVLLEESDLMSYYVYPIGFEQDLNLFIENIPSEWKKIHDDFSFQDDLLREEYLPHVYVTKRFSYFVICLYWKVLVDYIAYTHYSPSYERGDFKRWKAPKYVGGCCQGCYNRFSPKYLFLGHDHVQEPKQPMALINKSIQQMKEHVLLYLRQEVREIDAEEFWSKCVNEFPDWAKLQSQNHR
jgi:hypothetical protein